MIVHEYERDSAVTLFVVEVFSMCDAILGEQSSGGIGSGPHKFFVHLLIQKT